MTGARRWTIYEGVDGIWRDQVPLLKGGPSVEVMPVAEHEEIVAHITRRLEAIQNVLRERHNA